MKTIWDNLHEVNTKAVAHTSVEAYELFDDRAYSRLLISKGVDLKRKIKYVVYSTIVLIYYID